jgi:hypothetical protein
MSYEEFCTMFSRVEYDKVKITCKNKTNNKNQNFFKIFAQTFVAMLGKSSLLHFFLIAHEILSTLMPFCWKMAFSHFLTSFWNNLTKFLRNTGSSVNFSQKSNTGFRLNVQTFLHFYSFFTFLKDNFRYETFTSRHKSNPTHSDPEDRMTEKIFLMKL